ncbi:DUF4192 domain-containing protein [soil metagenome]
MTVPVASVGGMTSQHPAFDSPEFGHHPDFDLTRPGALIAALPAMLGFTPENSLILVTVARGEIGAVLRADLSSELIDGLDSLVNVAAAAYPDAALAIIVDPEGALCPMCVDEHRRLCSTLADELGAHDILLRSAHIVDRVSAGGRWHCVDGCGSRGIVDDPESSPVALAAVLDGRRLYGRRADLLAVISVDDQQRCRRLAEAIEALQQGGGDSGDRTRGVVEDGLAAVERIVAGAALSDAEIAVLAHGLSDVQARDTLYALAVGERADAAETLWAALSRCLPEPWRVEVLVQLAFCAYVRGDGPLAGLSLEQALCIDPGHRMAGLLDDALQRGLRPEDIRKLAQTGYRLARELGVELPARRTFGQRAG